MIDLAIIEQRDDSDAAENDYLSSYYSEMVKRVCDGFLKRLRQMANAIENEPPGRRKQAMLLKYEEVDKELEEWQRLKLNSDMLSKLDK